MSRFVPDEPCKKCGTSLATKTSGCVECRRRYDESNVVTGAKRAKAVELAKPYLGVRWCKMGGGNVAFKSVAEIIDGVRVFLPVKVETGLTKELAKKAAMMRDANMRKYIIDNGMEKNSIRMNFPEIGEMRLDRSIREN